MALVVPCLAAGSLIWGCVSNPTPHPVGGGDGTPVSTPGGGERQGSDDGAVDSGRRGTAGTGSDGDGVGDRGATPDAPTDEAAMDAEGSGDAAGDASRDEEVAADVGPEDVDPATVGLTAPDGVDGDASASGAGSARSSRRDGTSRQ